MSVADNFPRLSGESDIEWLFRIMGEPKYLAAVADRAANELWEAGAPVWRADEGGIYNLHRDGTKEYLDSKS